MLKTYIEKIYNKDGGVINIDSSTKKSSFGHALYYPHIHLTNENWLKHAFLFWDKISRIVPSSFEPQDNENVIRIRQETDFLEDYYPHESLISNTFMDFTTILDHYLHSKDDWIEHVFNSESYYKQSKYKELFKRTDYPISEDGAYIYVENMTSTSIKKLSEFGFVTHGKDKYSNWIKIDNEIGSLYMKHLAKSISNEKSIPIVTDREDYLNSGISKERIYRNEFEEQLGYLVIDSVVPKKY